MTDVLASAMARRTQTNEITRRGYIAHVRDINRNSEAHFFLFNKLIIAQQLQFVMSFHYALASCVFFCV